jgi:peptidyl-dipeptidase A
MRPKLLRRALRSVLVFCVLPLLVACGGSTETPAGGDLQAEVQAFLDGYHEKFIPLNYEAALAEWDANTHIVEGDESTEERVKEANQALTAYTGSVEVIETTRGFLDRKEELDELQVRQLESILYRAAGYPQTVPDLVERRIVAEAAQNKALFAYEFKVDGEVMSANAIDSVLVESKDLDKRLAAWQASKGVGDGLKEGLAELVELRNGTSQALGYDDFFAYQVSAYDMTVDEMMELNRRFIRELWPLYRELHTWARYELAEEYGAEVPELLPAHWLPNRWSQDWSEMVTVEGIDLNAALADKTAEDVVKEAEAFYVSLGFDPLPQVFWDKSSLYPLPEGAEYKKNNHASAWHMDLQDDVRSLMSVENNQRWWETTHHELGHIYYYMSYSRPEVPVVLRGGANRGFHEAVGSLLGLASTQKAFLVGKGLIEEGVETDPGQALLKEALNAIVFIPWSSGVMTHFEHDLYSTDLSPEEYNQRWWHYVRTFQGVEPPAERGEEHCDAASKTHINNDPAQYYDYAFSYVLLAQLHAHIAENILGQDPANTNYWGSTETGDFLNGILELGATRDWRTVLRESLGSDLSAEPMLRYYQPVMDYLKKVNEGREHSLPEQPEI